MTEQEYEVELAAARKMCLQVAERLYLAAARCWRTWRRDPERVPADTCRELLIEVRVLVESIRDSGRSCTGPQA